MPNQLQITDIHIENTDADTATVATDRPVGEKDLATLGVAETFLAASKFEGKIGQTALLPDESSVVLAVGTGSKEISIPD